MAITGEGIDVSYAQDLRDPVALRAAVSGGYVWVKIWDADPDRPVKLEQVAILRAAGFKVGGYGFFRDRPPAEQAAGFLCALAQTDAHDIPPMLDLEPTDIGQWGFRNTPAGGAAAANVGRHVHTALEWNGYDPVLYSGESFFGLLNTGTWGFPVRRVVANYSAVPKLEHVAHQYTSSAQLPGLAPGGRIDRIRTAPGVDLTARKEGPMAWRVATSLQVLLGQLDDLAPNRSRISDGSIGDTSHQNRNSDHNPWHGPGIVTARDFTHDPNGGLSCHWLADTLVASRDPRIKYIIWNNRILDSRPGNNPWKWVPYHGSNPHTKHLHLSVMPNSSADSPTAWNLGANEGEDEMAAEDVAKILAKLDALHPVINSSVSTHNTVFYPPKPGQDRSKLDVLVDMVTAVETRSDHIEDAVEAMQQKLASLETGGVDLEQLAAAVAGKLSEQLAKSVADELRNRMES